MIRRPLRSTRTDTLLPSTTRFRSLRAFESGARHLAFTKAAGELHVTQAAISHQVKALEDHLGLPLFRRLNRRLVLTEAGQLYLPVLREAFDAIPGGARPLQPV